MIKIDENKTIEKVRSLLSQYRRINRLSPYPDMKREELSQISKIALREKEKIDLAMLEVEETYKEILYYRYICPENKTDRELQGDLFKPESTYYRHLRTGEIQFAEGYDSGILIVYKIIDTTENGKKKSTRAKAKEVLNSYRSLKRMSKNTNENDVSVPTISTFEELEEIESAIQKVENKYQKILVARYLESEKKNDITLKEELNIKHNTFYNYLKAGELEFAQFYNKGELIISEND